MSIQSFRSYALVAAVFAGAAVVPSSLRGQESASPDSVNSATQAASVATSTPVSTTVPAPAAGPRVAPAGITRLMHAGPSGPAQSRDENPHLGAGANVAMIGTGAAALVVGLMVGGNGGNMVALGGGVVGLVGLYRYLR